MKTLILFCLGLALAWATPWGDEHRSRPEPSSAYLALRGKLSWAEPGAEPRQEPRPEPRREWGHPEPHPEGVSLNLSPEEFYHYQKFKKMMEEKKEKEEEEKKKNEDFAKLDEMMGKYEEVKHHYLFTVTLNLLKFCRCSELSNDMTSMFKPEDNGSMGGMKGSNASMPMDNQMEEESHLDRFLKLVYGETELTPELFGKIKEMKMADMKKLSFGGLVKSLCWKSKSYISKLKALRAKYEAMAKQQSKGGM